MRVLDVYNYFDSTSAIAEVDGAPKKSVDEEEEVPIKRYCFICFCTKYFLPHDIFLFAIYPSLEPLSLKDPLL